MTTSEGSHHRAPAEPAAPDRAARPRDRVPRSLTLLPAPLAEGARGVTQAVRGSLSRRNWTGLRSHGARAVGAAAGAAAVVALARARRRRAA
ncbi:MULTISPECIES: hypothetical protein [unclassified Streptomyces]|uniref:hypothetical protein n=1 Tax=unclassified Streptomyces TaxID=2593676 RepID=UPI002E14773D|nr:MULTISPECIES: hypothetical protein [unclassified Streptomyces]WSR23936.1 hypothetical protein OG573_35990 [Streptomyces sp. NBC_01205]